MNHKSANCLAMTMVHSSLSQKWFNCQYLEYAFTVRITILVSNIWSFTPTQILAEMHVNMCLIEIELGF